MDTILLLARLYLGLGIAVHGAQKLTGWFGGYGLAGTGGFFEQLGFKPGRLFAALAGLGESTGGLLVALGLLGPIGPAIVVLVMLVAAGTVHIKNGFLSSKNGVELPLLYAIGAALLAFTGPGAYSLDNALGLHALASVHVAWIALASAIAGAMLNIGARHRPVPPKAAA
ncbi:MAG TPA: DoxX family protein [Gemmatimonadaceae bacterium]|nr:DoxX family protein [Gemmatimonadaceae bacterium]